MYSPSVPFAEYLQGEQIKYSELTIDAIQTLKDGLKDNKSLPLISDKKYLAFLHSCYFDQELAKKTVQYYYKCFFNIPQVFSELNPLADDIKQNYKCVSVGQLPCTNLDKNIRILFVRLIDNNHELFEYVPLYRYLAMWLNYSLLTYGTCDGIIAVVDSTGLNWRHIIKLPFGVTGKILKFLETGLPIRLKAIHILNTGTATQMLMKIISRFANEYLLEKIILHPPGSEDIFSHVPRNIIPVESGGTGKSCSHFNDELYNNLIDNRDIFFEDNEILNNYMMYANQQTDE